MSEAMEPRASEPEAPKHAPQSDAARSDAATEPVTPDAPQFASPVAASERIVSLDVLRGVAILGILLMNIQSFSMIGAAYFNPTAYGDLTGLNRFVWMFSHMVADTKFISIFSMLFGAGIVLFASKLEGRGLRPGIVHYRRTFWLLVIGLVHGYLLWPGDILTVYALIGFLVYLFWRRSPLALFITGILVICVVIPIYVGGTFSYQYWPPEQIEAMMSFWAPNAEEVAAELAGYRGGFGAQMPFRANEMTAMLSNSLFFYMLWRVGGMMLVGMALYKWGILSAKKSTRFYAIAAVVGLAAGYPIIYRGIVLRFADGWSMAYSFFAGSLWNYVGSAFVAWGYIALVMLCVKSGVFRKLQGWLANAGRMAFTNYLLQTVICTLIFYGHGLGLFGSVPRSGQILIVFAVWIFELWFSTFWLERFRFGPAEWLWRTLTYFKSQPMRRWSEERQWTGQPSGSDC